jgi:hypothetical protein
MRRAATLLAPRLVNGASSSSSSSSTAINAAAALATAARSFAADAAVAADSLLKTPLYDLHVENGGAFGVAGRREKQRGKREKERRN